MTSPIADSPVRIGLVGLGPSGAYHLERLSFRDDLHVVIACDEHGDPKRRQARSPNVLSQVGDLLGRSDVDWVLITAPLPERARLALRALEAGKNVALESPPCVDARQLQAMTEAASDARRLLAVLPTRREAVDFRAACHAVFAGTLGSIEAARIVCWAKAVPPDAASLSMNRSVPETPPGDGVFSFFAYQYVDQLLQLVRQQAKSVFAKIRHPPETDPTATAFFLSITFANSDSVIDVNLHAGAALQTGWVLAGSAGSYCQQRIFLTDPSGEVCDTPIAATDVPPLDIYADLTQTTRGSSATRLESAAEALTVLQIIDAARRSARIGQVVELSD